MSKLNNSEIILIRVDSYSNIKTEKQSLWLDWRALDIFNSRVTATAEHCLVVRGSLTDLLVENINLIWWSG